MNAINDLVRFNLLGSSSSFQQACAQIRKIAKVDVTVFIAGETGTGKEMAARAIHYQGNRHTHPFIPVNCGALPENLLESELFGHERGAFTDAKIAFAGLVSEADGGTLFLDEVDSLSLKAQAALLRFLQDHTYRRVGSATTRQANVRIIVASNADMESLIDKRQFRRDLLYRLNVLMLHMPPLRMRQGDALELAKRFLARFSHQYRVPQKFLHADAVAFIQQYSWPGNVRELENVMLRAFLMCDGSEIGWPLSDDQVPSSSAASHMLVFKEAKARAIADFERGYIHNILRQTKGNLSHAAKLAGQDRSAFGKLARKHGVSPSANVHSMEDAQ